MGGRMNAGMYSSARPCWETPPELFEQYRAEFELDLDVCAFPENAKLDHHYSPEDDGLGQPWAPARCWMNPPYGRAVEAWVRKAFEESQLGALVVALLPARTDTAWFQDWVLGKAELRFLRGRVKFVGAENSAPFPSVIAIYRPAPPMRPGQELSDRQLAILAYVAERLREGVFPSLREIGDRVGLSSSASIHSAVIRLEKLGRLRRVRGPRGIRLASAACGCPVCGRSYT